TSTGGRWLDDGSTLTPRIWISTFGYCRRYSAKSAASKSARSGRFNSLSAAAVTFAIRSVVPVGPVCGDGSVISYLRGSATPKLDLDNAEGAVDLLSNRLPASGQPEVKEVVPPLPPLAVNGATIVGPCINAALPRVAVLAEPDAGTLPVHPCTVVRDDDGLDRFQQGILEVDLHMVSANVQRVPDRLREGLHGSLSGVRKETFAHFDRPGCHASSQTPQADRLNAKRPTRRSTPVAFQVGRRTDRRERLSYGPATARPRPSER